MIAFSPAWPSRCEVCASWSSASLCADCSARFTAPVPRCHRCALRLGAPAPACGDCLNDPPPFESAACAVDYGFPWDRLIGDFKFRDRAELAATFAGYLAKAVRLQATTRPDWLVPVPLAPQRLRERGYNQAWELAWRVAARCGLAARHDLLLRPLDGGSQLALGRAERRRNLASVFMVEPRLRDAIRGRSIALVDDVMTTGATAREAAAALLRAGAASVQAWAFARTPA